MPSCTLRIKPNQMWPTGLVGHRAARSQGRLMHRPTQCHPPRLHAGQTKRSSNRWHHLVPAAPAILRPAAADSACRQTAACASGVRPMQRFRAPRQIRACASCAGRFLHQVRGRSRQAINGCMRHLWPHLVQLNAATQRDRPAAGDRIAPQHHKRGVDRMLLHLCDIFQQNVTILPGFSTASSRL